MSEPLFHIATASAWARSADSYAPADFAREGFIHCSTRGQVVRVANRLFRGRSDLVLLMIDVERIDAPLRYENLEGGSELFPHIYGPLPRVAVLAVEALLARSDGTFDTSSAARCMTLADMQVEPATAHDCRAVAEVHVESWQQAYKGLVPEHYLASLLVSEREAMWRRLVERQPAHLLVARSADRVAGFVAFGASRDEGAPADCAEIGAIYVKPQFWSAGAGRLLWLAALQRIQVEGYKTVSLWVIAGNERAIRFYERAGFVADAGSRRQFEVGGATLAEVRYVFDCGC